MPERLTEELDLTRDANTSARDQRLLETATAKSVNRDTVILYQDTRSVVAVRQNAILARGLCQQLKACEILVRVSGNVI